MAWQEGGEEGTGKSSTATWNKKKTNKAKKQTNPEDAFATRHRYNLDNLYLNIVVSTQALTDRCFDLESVVSVRYFH